MLVVQKGILDDGNSYCRGVACFAAASLDLNVLARLA
jgi:hypothetical protein